MTALLEERAAAVDPMRLPFLVNDLRADIFAEQLTWPRPMSERLDLPYSYAMELVKAGRVPEALAAMDALQDDTPYSLRHSFGSLLIAARISPAFVQQQMGHQSIAMTVDVYGSWLPVRVEGAVDRLAGATGPHGDTLVISERPKPQEALKGQGA